MRIRMVPAGAEDCKTVWEWRNDPTTRENSFTTGKIPYKDHVKWFGNVLHSEKTKLLMLVLDGKKIGNVRFDLSDGMAEIHINMNPAFRGKGLGSLSISESCRYAFKTFKINKIIAKIKPSNERSINAFSKAGFSTTKKNDIIEMALTR